MSKQLVECVPNFSEGRNAQTVDAIAAAIGSVSGIAVLDKTLDPDHNRSVITFAGAPGAIGEAAVRGVEKAVELIDLTAHDGVHPRIGAADVVPFVPIEGVTLEDCAAIARETGVEIWRRLGVPVYFYEAAATQPDRVNLENIRNGKFEGFPDVGDRLTHRTAGATVVGARKFLIAFNVNLDTPDVEIAKEIARAIRASSGGLPFLKAIGVRLESRNLAQVSMNLTDFERTPVHQAFEAVREQAARHGVGIRGSEIVGLIPKKALESAAGALLHCENFSSHLVLENRLASAAVPGGMTEFLGDLASTSSRMGGGSAAAAAAAMAASLGAFIRELCDADRSDFDAAREFFTLAIDRDVVAFERVMAARGEDRERALYDATLVPLEVAESAARLKHRLDEFRVSVPMKFLSDIITAQSLAAAATRGAIATAHANLAEIHAAHLREPLEKRLRALE